MGALHFLEHGFCVADQKDGGVCHDVELFETGGELFIRMWVGGVSANNPVTGKMTIQQASQLAEGAQAFAARLRD